MILVSNTIALLQQQQQLGVPVFNAMADYLVTFDDPAVSERR